MVGLLLVAIAVVLALETGSLLPGGSATTEDIESITAAIEVDGGWIIHLRTLHLGPAALTAPQHGRAWAGRPLAADPVQRVRRPVAFCVPAHR